MIGALQGLLTTLKTLLRRPVTVQYPDEHLPLSPRFKGFPGMLFDEEVGEPKCTGCGVCALHCPTSCLTVTARENENFAQGKSRRRHMVEEFNLDLGRCLVCAICVEVCPYKALEMSHQHEISRYQPQDLVVDKTVLLQWQREKQVA